MRARIIIFNEYSLIVSLFVNLASFASFASCRDSIPERLSECYRTREIPGLPMNLRVLIDLIRKGERYAYASLDARTMSSSLLHRFRFDGIEYQGEFFIDDDGIAPFGATGSQRAGNSIVEELVPGDHRLFPSESLSFPERCLLHRAISSAIREHPAATEDKFCTETVVEKINGRSNSDHVTFCPVENGVVVTPFGTIAPGRVITAIAASLQPQRVAVALLTEPPKPYFNDRASLSADTSSIEYNAEEIDLIQPKNKMILVKSMWLEIMKSSPMKLDNVWASTLAGDLAEVTNYQGPIFGEKVTLGATGFWNSTMIPRMFYLTEKTGRFDATRAEIVGDIDGLLIANRLGQWIDQFHSLRLSQILDMYYGYRGIVFDTEIKACERAKGFRELVTRETIEEQTLAFAQILGYRDGIAYVTSDALKRMTNYTINAFETYAGKYLFGEASCQRMGFRPRLEVLLAFDGAWSREYTADFLSVMLEDLDVSVYGSRMGILHGDTAEWWVNVTSSPATIYYALSTINDITWPTNFNCTGVLEAIHAYLNATWNENEAKNRIGNLGQVVALLIPRTVLSETEQRTAMETLQRIKNDHPDVTFLYYGSEYYSQSFERLVLTNQDRLIKSLKIDDANDYLSTVPRILRPPNGGNTTIGTRRQFEDYVAVGRDVTYKLHSYWRRNTKTVEVTFHGVGYGTLKVCAWRQWDDGERTENGSYCKELSGHNAISMIDYTDCRNGNECPHAYYRIQNATSTSFKCAEMDCQYPDNVRYIIRMESLAYSSSSHGTIIETRLYFLSHMIPLTLLAMHIR